MDINKKDPLVSRAFFRGDKPRELHPLSARPPFKGVAFNLSVNMPYVLSKIKPEGNILLNFYKFRL